MPSPSSVPIPPRLPGGYELLFQLAAGGMASVHVAVRVDGDLAELVAVKIPHPQGAHTERFASTIVDEAHVASAIHHANVVRVRELGHDDDERPFVALEYVEGAPMSDLLRALEADGRVLAPRVGIRLVLDALAGLHAAHTIVDDSGKPLGIVHRDVSPHNVLVGVDGLAKLADFGVAKAEDRVQVTRTHEVKGKLSYLAPERVDARRTCTPQSDVFAAGVILWEALVGRRLFPGDDPASILHDVVHAKIHSPRALGVDVSPAVDAVVLRALARDFETRFESADTFRVALEDAAGPAGVASRGEVATLLRALMGTAIDDRRARIEAALAERHVNGLAPLSDAAPPSEAPVDLDALGPRFVALAAPPPTRVERTRAALAGVPRRRALMVAGGVALAGVGLLVSASVSGPEPEAVVPPPPPPPEAPAGPAPRPEEVTARAEPAVRVVELDDEPRVSGAAAEPAEAPSAASHASASHAPAHGAAPRRAAPAVHKPAAAPAPATTPARKTKDGFTRLR